MRDLTPYQLPIVNALAAINERSGNRYPAPVLFEHLRRRVIERGFQSCLLLAFDNDRLKSGREIEDCVCGMLTLDLFEDEIGSQVAMISRAWCDPGMAMELWPVAKPIIWEWAKARNCVRIQCQSERDSAWARWLKNDGFEVKETILEVAL